MTDAELMLLTDLTSLNLGTNRNITDYGLQPLTNLVCLEIGANKQLIY